MNRTDIEWVKNPDGSKGFSVNPVKGLCPMACEYCYARRMYKRFKWNPEIVFDLAVLDEPKRIKKPSRIFWGSTMELFGPWIPRNYVQGIIEATRETPQHTHIFLTKQPQELGKYDWPSNCWVGVSAESPDAIRKRGGYGDWALAVRDAGVRFISFEPLLGPFASPLRWPDFVNWCIIGQQTPVRKDIPVEWVSSIVKAADESNIPVFQKDNLKGLFPTLRQEWPKTNPKAEAVLAMIGEG